MKTKNTRGFTLLEMLASVAVLMVVLYLVVQITNHASRVVQNTRRMDADSEARQVFNRLALDFSHMLKRGDLDYSAFKHPAADSDAGAEQSGNDRMAFYAETAGGFATPPGGGEKSAVSLVAYKVNPSNPNQLDPNLRTPSLQRLARGLGWEPSGGLWKNLAFFPLTLTGSNAQWPDLYAADNDWQSIGPQVFRFEYAYLLKPSGSAPARLSVVPWRDDARAINGFRDVTAIVVTISVLDETSRKIVADAKYGELINILRDVTDSDLAEGKTAAAIWNDEVNSPAFSARTGVPPPASSRVRIYERYFYLPAFEK